MIQKIVICLTISGILLAVFKALLDVFYAWIEIEIEKYREEYSDR